MASGQSWDKGQRGFKRATGTHDKLPVAPDSSRRKPDHCGSSALVQHNTQRPTGARDHSAREAPSSGPVASGTVGGLKRRAKGRGRMQKGKKAKKKRAK